METSTTNPQTYILMTLIIIIRRRRRLVWMDGINKDANKIMLCIYNVMSDVKDLLCDVMQSSETDSDVISVVRELLCDVIAVVRK